VVVPDGEDENVSLRQGPTHGSVATTLLEVGCVTKGALLSVAERVAKGVIALKNTREVGDGVGDDLAVLDVEAADLLESASAGAVVGNELGDDLEGLGSVDDLTGTIVVPLSETVWGEVATVSVAETTVAIWDTALLARAALEATVVCGVARMGGVGIGNGVGFPDIHLSAARAVVAKANSSRVPAIDVGLENMRQDQPGV